MNRWMRASFIFALCAAAMSCTADYLLVPFEGPTLSSISATSAVQGTTMNVSLTGTNFVANAMTISVSGTGVTVSNVVVEDETSASATVVVAADAPLGQRTIGVSTAGGVSVTRPFMVLPPPPTLTGLTPATGITGAVTVVTLTGTNFVAGATTVEVSGAGAFARNVNVTSATSLTAEFVVEQGAALTDRNVTVATAGGTSAARTFSIKPPPPTLTGSTVASGVVGTSVTVLLGGTNFVPGATVAVSGAGVTVTEVVVVSSSAISARFTIAADAALGARTVSVTTSGGVSGTATFTVLPPAPTASAITPGFGVQGTAVNVTITGANFITGSTSLTVSGTGVTVSNVVVASPTSITATFTVGATAPLGGRTVTVMTAGGAGLPLVFDVRPPAPTLTGISPAAGVQGAVIVVTLTGTNFVPGSGVTISGIGVAVSAISVQDANSISATFTISGVAPAGARTVVVETPGGATGAATFTVNLAPPTLAIVAPAAGTQGATVPVTLTGTNFVAGGTTVSVSGAGVTVSSVNVTGATTLTADFTIGAAAAAGGRSVTVTTGGGTSGAVTFTVNLAAPTLATVLPATGAQGGVRSVTLTGTGFVVGATTVNVSGAGVTVSNVIVSSSTTLTADFTTDLAAAVGARDVTVTTGGGTSGPQTFTVITGPSITSFAALATHLYLVQPVTVAWASSNSTSCTIMPTFFSVACASGSGIVTPGANVTYTMTASNAGASVTATTDIFVNEPGRWVFSTAILDDQLRMYSLNPATGDLTAIGGGTVAAGSDPIDVTVDPSGRYAYATNNFSDNISMYTIDATTGALASNGTIAAGNEPRAIAVDPTGRYAYAVNQNSAGTGSVSVYTINGSGQLVANGAAVAVGGQPTRITIDPLGKYVYVMNFNERTISMFAINADGTLASLGAEPNGGGAFGLAADPSGRFVYSTTQSNGRIRAYSIGSTGALIFLQEIVATGTMTGIAVDPTGRRVYATDSNNNFIHGYSINQASGMLTPLAGGGVATGGGPGHVAVDPQGKFVYTANQAGTISIFSINQSTGVLTLVNTVAAGSTPRSVVVSR